MDVSQRQGKPLLCRLLCRVLCEPVWLVSAYLELQVALDGGQAGYRKDILRGWEGMRIRLASREAIWAREQAYSTAHISHPART
jgi:hypothetical protein